MKSSSQGRDMGLDAVEIRSSTLYTRYSLRRRKWTRYIQSDRMIYEFKPLSSTPWNWFVKVVWPYVVRWYETVVTT